MERVKGVLTGAKEGWLKLDNKKRIAMIGIIATAILVASLLTYNSNKIDYAILFTNLEMQDAGIIVDDLETQGINYKLENNGRNILIDESLVDEYRLELAMNGMMPQSSTGFEIFDNTGMMDTDTDRQIKYQRALTGELQRSIMAIDAINSAKVILVMPEKSIFETEAKEASAAVVIDVKPTKKITQNTIKGVAALISGAVDNLPTENIQIVDSQGNLLTEFLNEDEYVTTLDVMSQHQEARSQFEGKIESNIIHLLEDVFGADNVKVSVLADMDFDSEESTEIIYSNEPVVRSEQIDASGGNINIQNVTGGSIDDNISNVMDSVGGDNSTYSKITNNELSSETKTVVKAPGKINRITTSVLYNNGIISAGDKGIIESIVMNATGYDVERGDSISVEGIEFTARNKALEGLENLKNQIAEEETQLSKYGNYILIGALALFGILLIAFLIRRFATRKQRAEDKLFQEGLALELDIDSVLASVNDEQDDILKILPDNKGDKAQKYAKENPELAADLIKVWMKDVR